MTDSEKLLDILMDELPDKHPWEGEIRKLRDRLIANGVTFARDINVPNKWISVKDRLPEKKGGYIVCTDKGGILLSHWYGNKWGGGYASKHITHWMPLPEPPTTCHMTREQPKGE